MFEIIFGAGMVFFFTWLDARSRGLTIFGNQRALPPISNCRACGEPLPADPILRCKMIDGTELCEDCNDLIELEVGLTYPDWFDRALPAEQETKFGLLESPKLTMYHCANCNKEHEEDHICMEAMEKFDTKPDPEPPGGSGNCFAGCCLDCGAAESQCQCSKKFSQPGGNGGNGGDGSVRYERVNPWGSELVLVRTKASMLCQNPRMNAVITDPWRPKPGELTDDEMIHFFKTGVRYCVPCKVDHRENEKCPLDTSGPVTPKQPAHSPHNCHYCAKPIVSKGLCDRCILWGAPSNEPCNTCTYYHESGSPHPDVFRRAFDTGQVYEFICRRVSEGYNNERDRRDRWGWR